jgi:hypothetical protein
LIESDDGFLVPTVGVCDWRKDESEKKRNQEQRQNGFPHVKPRNSNLSVQRAQDWRSRREGGQDRGRSQVMVSARKSFVWRNM